MKNRFEWTNASTKYTGISGIVYISTKDELPNKGNSLGRVEHFRDGQLVFCTIKKDKDGKRTINGDVVTKDLEMFVEKNENVLWEYWNTSKEIADSVEMIRKLIKVQEEK